MHPKTKPPMFTVLLVEDEEIVREVTKEVLEGAGYHVLEAAGPEEALAVAERFEGHINVLLTDIIMPSMNGQELAKRLSATHPDMIRIFMSGYAKDALLRGSLGLHRDRYIQKPFTVSSLLSHVSEALSMPAEDYSRLATSHLPM